jgi:hypothetical protein
MKNPYTVFLNRIRPLQNKFAQSYIAWKYDYKDLEPIFKWNAIGVKRFDLIDTIIKNNKYDSYLEIGCQGDVNFKKIQIKNKVGVDPATGGTLRITSDSFFEKNTQYFDLIFIDGLHTYEQARRDIYNSYKWLNKGGIIVVHDMLPSTWQREHVPRISNAWNGTVWKVAYEFNKLLGKKFGIIIADEGLGVIFKDEIMAVNETSEKEFEDTKKKTYKDFLKDYKNFNIAPVNEMEKIVQQRLFS